jgi:hypothetical protein
MTVITGSMVKRGGIVRMKLLNTKCASEQESHQDHSGERVQPHAIAPNENELDADRRSRINIY